jgi:hypothetical protein
MVCTNSWVASTVFHCSFQLDIINIVTVTVFGVEHRFNDGFTYGQAFWMTVCSTSVSSFVNVTLIVDLVQTQDFSNSGENWSPPSSSLIDVDTRKWIDTKTTITCSQCHDFTVLHRLWRSRSNFSDRRDNIPQRSLLHGRDH